MLSADLNPNTVQVLCVSREQWKPHLDSWWMTLSDSEKMRCDRCLVTPAQEHFLAGRGLLRHVLGKLLNKAPSEVVINADPQCKPILLPPDQDSGLQFNLSHSGDWLLLAITRFLPVGVDVECVREQRIDAIVTRFFSKQEIVAWNLLSKNEQPLSFLRGWTRKEAYLKARGDGLSGGLDSFTVSLGVEAHLLHVEDPEVNHQNWCLFDVPIPDANYHAAVAVDNSGSPLQMVCETLSA